MGFCVAPTHATQCNNVVRGNSFINENMNSLNFLLPFLEALEVYIMIIVEECVQNFNLKQF